MTPFFALIKTSYELDNRFVSLFFLGFLFLVLIKIFAPKQFDLNITSPNIYIFEYESQMGKWFSLYNLFFFLVKLISYILFMLAISQFHHSSLHLQAIDFHVIPKLFLIFLIFILMKFFLELLFLFIIKKQSYYKKLQFIRISFDNYLAFYLFILSFLIFYFPSQPFWFFWVIIGFSVLWFIFFLLNLYNSLSKHSDLKSYQIILYLCLSEILPFIVVIGWIIFQIL